MRRRWEQRGGRCKVNRRVEFVAEHELAFGCEVEHVARLEQCVVGVLVGHDECAQHFGWREQWRGRRIDDRYKLGVARMWGAMVNDNRDRCSATAMRCTVDVAWRW